MKRWWLIVAAIATFFVGDRVGGVLIQSLMDRSPQRFCRLYAGRFDAEIVCIGNSRGVVTLSAPAIAEATGRTAANISYNGMSAQIARAIFNDYLEHNRKPKLLVIEASFVTTETGKGLAGDYKPFWSHSERLRDIGKMYCRNVVQATSVTQLYQFNSELCLRSLYYLLLRRGDQNSSMAGTLSSALIDEVNQMLPFDLAIEPIEIDALYGMIDDAHKVGVDVKLVYAPYLPAYAAKIANLDAYLKDLADRAGTDVIDLSRALDDEELFADRVHVNPAGTREMTKLLVERGVFSIGTP